MSAFALVRSIFMMLCRIPRFQGGTYLMRRSCHAWVRLFCMFKFKENRIMTGSFLKQDTPNTKEGGNTTDKSVTGMESAFR